MKERSAKRRVQLDWSRLLGFDQAPAPESGSDRALRRLRLAKVGTKLGAKPGVKTT